MKLYIDYLSIFKFPINSLDSGTHLYLIPPTLLCTPTLPSTWHEAFDFSFLLIIFNDFLFLSLNPWSFHYRGENSNFLWPRPNIFDLEKNPWPVARWIRMICYGNATVQHQGPFFISHVICENVYSTVCVELAKSFFSSNFYTLFLEDMTKLSFPFSCIYYKQSDDDVLPCL